MERIDHLQVDKAAHTATIGAGMTIRSANKQLYEQGLSFPVVGSIDEISVGGLFAAADHGSSMMHASSADRAIACTLVTADGHIRSLSINSVDEEEVNLFKVTGCGAGATGVIVDITFQLDGAFGLAPAYEEISVRELLARGSGEGGLVDVAKQNEYVKVGRNESRFSMQHSQLIISIAFLRSTDVVFPQYYRTEIKQTRWHSLESR